MLAVTDSHSFLAEPKAGEGGVGGEGEGGARRLFINLPFRSLVAISKGARSRVKTPTLLLFKLYIFHRHSRLQYAG